MTGSRWNESLETGNEFIDRQHRELNAFVDDLRVNHGESRADVLSALDRVMDFALDHLLAEELLMRQVGYPLEKMQQMMEQNREFKARARLLVFSFRAGETLSVQPILLFLEEFLRVHESGQGRMLVPLIHWIRERGEGLRA